MTKRFVYSKAHLAYLENEFKKLSIVDLTDSFNAFFGLTRSVKSIQVAIRNHRFTCDRKTGDIKKGVPIAYTKEHKEWFIENYPKFSRKAITIEFNRVFNENRKQSSVIAFLKNHKIQSGRTAHFVAGNKSWNSGTKGLMKPNSGSFKKGEKAPNHMPVGSERINGDGYADIKIADPDVWLPKHRVLWESVNGPIPDGHIIRFKNGDKTEIEIDNLILVNRAEHGYLNCIDFNNYLPEYKDTVLLIARVHTKALQVSRNE